MRAMTLVPRAAEEVDETDIRRELLRAMLQQTRTALTAHVVVGLITLVVVWQLDRTAGVFAWYAVLLAWVGARAVLARRWLARWPAMDAAGVRRTEWQLTALVAGSGLTWGLLPWLSYNLDNPFVSFFVVAMLVGLCTGVVSAAAAVPAAMVAHLGTMFGPFVVLAASLGGFINWAGCVTVVFLCMVLMSFSRTAHRAMRHTFVVTRQNVRLADALRVERDAVRDAMRAKDLFLAGVTHDLRQPVHALALHLSYLRRLPPAALTPELLRRTSEPMELALKAMSRQLTRLLELSRLEAGEVHVQCRWVPLAEVFATVAAQFEARARDKGLQWRARTPAGAVHSDPKMLLSIVENLVANAVRYTDRGGVLLAARHRPTGVELRVFDTGCGIPAEGLPRLFEPYRRFDDRIRSDDEGHGLGLALAGKQAALLGCRISVRSVPGRGSVFTVHIPQLAATAAAAPSDDAGPTLEAVAPPPARP
jgi:signal transduction histidine kinase